MLKKQKKCTFSNKKKGMALSKRKKKTKGILPMEAAALRLPNPFQIGACTLAGTIKK